MISIKELHSADAWRYLMESITDGQGDLREASAITRYYSEAGTPPGRWLGSGLAGLGKGRGLEPGSLVSGEQLDLLLGRGHDPVTGETLGRGFHQPPSYQERVAARIRALPKRLSKQAHAIAIKQIRSEERVRRIRRGVAGFDYTFSPPKSVSALWAIADQGTREQLTAAHHAAIDDVLRLMERDVARTRIGMDGVAQVLTQGLIAATFDHYDSREHDPQLHTHVVIANRVQGQDGGWRTLDSRGMLFPSAVALSVTYDDLLADSLTQRLGVGWEVRDQGRKLKNAKWEIAGMPTRLIEHFSQRRDQIQAVKDSLVNEYRERTGREPDDATVLRIRQQATWRTRREKTVYPLATLADWWRHRAAKVLDISDPTQLVRQITRPNTRRTALRADDFAGRPVKALTDEVLARLHESRSTWSHWNILAETARATMKYRLATSDDRDQLHKQVAEAVKATSVLLSAPPPAITPAAFRRPDGSSQFTREFAAVYTSRAVQDAEARLLDAGRAVSAPRVGENLLERLLEGGSVDGQRLEEDQAASVFAIASSGRCLDILIGPAGSGKTLTLGALRVAWETQHGPGTVIGLAPTSQAAEVLAKALNIPTENTAKWLTEHARTAARREQLRRLMDRTPRSRRAAQRLSSNAAAVREELLRWELRPGQLLIVDEASMCGTLALDRITSHARAVGAKVLMVGDWAQLSAVESGGALRMLANERPDAPELSGVRRFADRWERVASIRLRVGDLRAIDDYDRRHRVRGGATADMMSAAYEGWAADERMGKSSLLVVDTNDAVAELNTRARSDRVTWGMVEPDGVRLHDGTTAGVGDRIVTRTNDRTLCASPTSWVKNGDHWTVVRCFADGSIAVQRTGGTHPGGVLTLPAGYVADDVELAYAVTAHRSQGLTVDTTHALVRPAMYRELLYVAMTRARESNMAYVCTDTYADDEYLIGDELSVREVLERVLSRSGADLSAHETMRAEQDRVGSIAQLAAEYDTIARQARSEHWLALTEASFPDSDANQVTQALSWPGLVEAWRRAEASGLDVEAAAPRLAAGLPNQGDPLAVLRDRVERWIAIAGPRTVPEQRYIAGLVPTARVSDPDVRQALHERAVLIEQRAEAIVFQALADGEPWLDRLGQPPADPAARIRWELAAATVAAYRERHGVTDPRDPIGRAEGGGQWTRRADRRRAQRALDEARTLATPTAQPKNTQAVKGIGFDRDLARDI